MIGVLGQSPISSVLTAGRQSFMSVLRNGPSKAYCGKDSFRHPRAYTLNRGMLVDERYMNRKGGNEIEHAYVFQFNPQTISDVKETLYEVRGYTGLPYNDYVWKGGGERTISFQLFLDDTPQSHTVNFGNTPQAWKIKGEGNALYANGSAINQFKENANSSIQSIKERISPAKGNSDVPWEETSQAHSYTRIHVRGILPEVEKISSFLYPAPVMDAELPRFSSGGILDSPQFRPPATAVLSLGPLYIKGVVKSAPVQYTLFDSDLTPIRATIDLEFSVFEFINVSEYYRKND